MYIMTLVTERSGGRRAKLGVTLNRDLSFELLEVRWLAS